MSFQKIDGSTMKVNLTNIDQYKKEAKQKVLANVYVQKFIQENNIPEMAIDACLADFIRLTEINEPCLNCKCLKDCKKDIKGLQAKLVNMGVNRFDIHYIPCAYREAYDKYATSYLHHDFPEEWMGIHIEDLARNNERRVLLHEFMDLLEQNKKSIYVYGKLGLGKSYATVALCDDYIDLHHGKVAFINTRKMVSYLRDLIHTDREAFDSEIKNLKQVDLLVFDDIGSEYISDWSTENIIYDVVLDREQKGKTTIFTSDFSLKELAELYGKKDALKNRRLFNMLNMYTTEIELEGIRVK